MPGHTEEAKPARTATQEKSTAAVEEFCKSKSCSHAWLQTPPQGCLKLATNCSSTWQPMEAGHMIPLWHACSVLTLQLPEGICPGEAFRTSTEPTCSGDSYAVPVEILWPSPHLWPSHFITTQHFQPQLLQSAQSLKMEFSVCRTLWEITATIILVTPWLCNIPAKIQHMPLTFFAVLLAELHIMSSFLGSSSSPNNRASFNNFSERKIIERDRKPCRNACGRKVQVSY